MEVWEHTKKRETLIKQRFSLFLWNILYAAFYTLGVNTDRPVFYKMTGGSICIKTCIFFANLSFTILEK